MIEVGTAGSSTFATQLTRRRLTIAALGAVLRAGAGGLPGRGTVLAAPNVSLVYFAETGHHLQLDFLQFWRTMGGTELFGLPLTE
ncbi:MAG: hypothetical protein C4289_02620, partial [Chloroflexota bacterium]